MSMTTDIFARCKLFKVLGAGQVLEDMLYKEKLDQDHDSLNIFNVA